MPLASMWRHLGARFIRRDHPFDEAGASLVEYTLLVVLVVIAAFVAMHFVGGTTSNSLNSSGSSIFAP